MPRLASVCARGQGLLRLGRDEWSRVQAVRTDPALSLLEASIARLGASDEPYSAASATVEQVILECVDRLDSPTTEVACVRMFAPHDGRSQCPHHRPGDRAPGRTWDSPQSDRPHHSHGSCRVQSRGAAPFLPAGNARFRTRAGTNAFDLIAPATRTVNRFLLAIRLLYSVTSTGIYEVTGETSEIGRYAVHLRVLDYMEHPICLRPAVLSRDSAGPIQAILTLYDTVVPPETDKQVIQPLDMAFLKYGGTFSAKRWRENVVDLTTALEASISGTDKTDISLSSVHARHGIARDGR
jgi:hypothetical protein